MDKFDDFLGEEPKENGIAVTYKYKIDTLDVLNVVVKERYTPKLKEDGTQPEDYWKAISYHPSLELAFKSIVDKEINITCSKGIEEVIKKIEELKNFKKVITI